MQTRRRPGVINSRDGWKRMRNRNVRVKLPVPDQDVQTLDLLD